MKNLEQWYLHKVKLKELVLDHNQLSILQQLDVFIKNFAKKSFFSKLFRQHPKKLGVYIYGSFGQGKSMIINEVYHQIVDRNKLRIHFHDFMKYIHQQLAMYKNVKHPLQLIATGIRSRYRIIFLDEMHVSDIASAMILKNLFTHMFALNTYILTSSNYAPEKLYPQGLMRERFIPTIDLIKQKMEVIHLAGDYDYRFLDIIHGGLFFINDKDGHDKLDNIFKQVAISDDTTENNFILIQGRQIAYIKKSSNIIWFEFDTLCGDGRSQIDYLELSNQFKHIIIENISPIQTQDKARRFTYLVDILYDKRLKLILSSSCELEQLYTQADFAYEFRRTVSRLTEMRNQKYLTQTNVESAII